MGNVRVTHYLEFLKKYVYLLLLFPVLVLMLVYLLNQFFIPAKFSTNSQILVKFDQQASPNLEMLKASIQLIPTFSSVIQSKEIEDEVEQRLNRPIHEKLAVQTTEGSLLVTIALTGEDQTEVVRVADTYTEVIAQRFPKLFEGNEILVLQKAVPAVKASKLFHYILALCIGELAALSFVCYLLLSDPIIFDKLSIQEMGVTFLGEVPPTKLANKISTRKEERLLGPLHRKKQVHKNVKILDEKKGIVPIILQNCSVFSGNPQVYIITSPNERDGKSVVSFYLAKKFSEAGYNTLLIDFNINNPELSEQLTCLKKEGVTDYLKSKKKVKDLFGYIHSTTVENLSFLSIGSASKYQNRPYRMNRTRKMFALLKENFDVVIVDTPAVSTSNVARVLGRQGDRVIMVVKSKQTRKKELTKAVKSLGKVEKDALGVLLNEN